MSARVGVRQLPRQAVIDAELASRKTPVSPFKHQLPGTRFERASEKRFAVFSDIEKALHRRRLIVLLPFAMIVGLVIYAGMDSEPFHWALTAIGVALAIAMAFSGATIQRLRVLVLLAAVWLGFAILPLHGALFGTPMLAYPVYGKFTAHVDKIISASPEARRIIVSNLQPDDPRDAVSIRRARLFLAPQPPLSPGDIIRAKLRLAPVPGPVLPGAFDAQFHAYFDGIGAYGNVTSELELVSAGPEFDLIRWVDTIRRQIGGRIDRVLTGQAAAIGWAMVVGDQSLISDETREVMSGAGLAHIYSISGLHMSLVAGGMFALLRLLLACMHGAAQTLPIKKIAAVGGIITACGYLLLAGGMSNVPAFRSTLMLALVFGAVLAGRRALTMRNVALAAIVIILIDPPSIFRASFQLSFAAVVGLIGVYEMPRQGMRGNLGWFGRIGKTVAATAMTSFIAGSATLLFSAYHFQQTAPLGVLGNVMALPIVSLVIMPAAMLGLLFMPLGVEGYFFQAMGWGIDVMLEIARLVASWSAGLEAHPLLSATALLIGLAALAWFAFLEGYWRYAGPILAIPAIVLFGFAALPDVLVADTTQAVAVRSDNGFGLLGGRNRSFAVKVWSEQFSEPIAAKAFGIRCDDQACVAPGQGFSVSLVKDYSAFPEDCSRNQLVVTRLRAPKLCRDQTTVIDIDDLKRGGVQWLRWQSGTSQFEIRPAITSLNRPWRILQR
ncbi:ComEC/Rec2 family competence protein [Devosia rhodophyticola]|uniref:ComEC/Rec2 family competence protein n=1 Tax=Devosia rhodophyticola TaxID=3026423 RepID=A0ABY7YX18_9HYPH|nr:ComEC/Rec2 family competence protein [Devosia rhodophyticola]WDR05894.1 ComEC/Rec2 family competence protein [Devosia rhodophyticola]